ncbi:MAG: nucleotidyltransferase domain-containing protein [Chitinophagaceae bacterium]|nr:nucleotidyltransferase domain-containing protein [Chitinophagaceae bacterium]
MISNLHLTSDEKRAVAEITERVMLLAGKNLQGMYLFGSKARGDDDEESDVDIAIIVSELNRQTKRSLINIVVEAETKYIVVISALVIDEEDFNLLLKRERRIALDIKKEGIDLVEYNLKCKLKEAMLQNASH